MHRRGLRTRLRARAVQALGGLLLATALVACGTLRADTCTLVRTCILVEERITEGAPRDVSDPQACEFNAARLNRVVGELRSLNIRDPSLRKAVERYRAEVEELADGYARLAASYRTPGLAGEELLQRRMLLRSRVMEDAADVDDARALVRSACKGS